MKLSISKSVLEFFRKFPEGSATIDLGKLDEKETVVVIVNENLTPGRFFAFLDVFVLEQDEVTVVILHVKTPYNLYEVVLNPANEEHRKIMELLSKEARFLLFFRDGRGKIVEMQPKMKEPFKKILEITKEKKWTDKEFMKAKEKIFKRYSIQDLQSLIRRWG